MTLGLRLIYSSAGAFFAPYLTLDPAFIRANRLTENLIDRSDTVRYALLGIWQRFDTLWYLHIAEKGYDLPEAAVFYPLYPLLIKVHSLLTGNALVAALLVSTVASFFLFWGFQKLLSLDLPRDLVASSLILFAVWPASFTYFAGYPESLLMALIVWSIYCARTGRWWLAGLLGFLAGLTKAIGLLAAVPLAVLALRERRWRTLPAIILCLAGPAAYALFLRWAGGPLPSEAYPKYWGTEVVFPWVTLVEVVRQLAGRRSGMLNANVAILTLVFAATFFKRFRLEYTLYAASALLIFLSKKTLVLLESTPRYVLEVFPVYPAIASYLDSRPARVIAMLGGFLANLYLMRCFFEWSLDV